MSDQKTRIDRELHVRKLAILNWLGDVGIAGVESRLRNLETAGIEVHREEAKCGYAAPESIEQQFGSETQVGVKVSMLGAPEGSVLVLFPPESANNAAAFMLRDAVENLSTVPREMAEDALTELCNMIASGFLDEWADLFEKRIDAGAPISVQHSEQVLVQQLVSSSDDAGLYITSRLRLPEYDIDAQIYLFPKEAEFVGAVSELELHHIGTSHR